MASQRIPGGGGLSERDTISVAWVVIPMQFKRLDYQTCRVSCASVSAKVSGTAGVSVSRVANKLITSYTGFSLLCLEDDTERALRFIAVFGSRIN